MRFPNLIALSLWMGLSAAQTLREPALSQLKTRAEQTDYVETSRYSDVVAFLDAAAQE